MLLTRLVSSKMVVRGLALTGLCLFEKSIVCGWYVSNNGHSLVDFHNGYIFWSISLMGMYFRNEQLLYLLP